MPSQHDITHGGIDSFPFLFSLSQITHKNVNPPWSTQVCILRHEILIILNERRSQLDFFSHGK